MVKPTQMNTTQIDYEKVLEAIYFTPWGEHENGDLDWGSRVLLHGPPGCGKTSTLRRLQKRLNSQWYNLKPGSKGQGAFAVVPMPKDFLLPGDKDPTTLLTYPGPDWMRAIGDQQAVVVVDEMNTAPPTIQPALLGMIQEKEMGSEWLGPKTRLFGCTNSTKDAAGGWPIAPAVANRLGHIHWPDPDLKQTWIPWLLNGGEMGEIKQDERPPIDCEAKEEEVMSKWWKHWVTASNLVAGYLSANLGAFREQPGDNDSRRHEAWASPRTWEYATRMLTTSLVHELNPLETSLVIRAYIGTSYTGFGSYLANQDLPDPEDILDGKVEYVHDTNRLDKNRVILNSCISTFKLNNDPSKVEERAKRFWSILGQVAKHEKDVAKTFATQMFHDLDLWEFSEADQVTGAIADHVDATSEDHF